MHHNKKSEGQLGEWGSKANEWSLRASVDHSLAHVLCAPSRSHWPAMVVPTSFALLLRSLFICVDLILRLPPNLLPLPFLYGRSVFFTAGRAVHSWPFRRPTAHCLKGQDGFPSPLRPSPFEPISRARATIPFSNTDDHDNHSMIVSTLDFLRLQRSTNRPAPTTRRYPGIPAA